jgi:hypothetical protein
MDDFIVTIIFWASILGAASTLPSLLRRLEDPFVAFLARILGKEIKKPPPPTYKERIGKLVNKLESASSDADDLLLEIAEVVKKRQKAVEQLEQDVSLLEEKEEEQKQKIADLENVSVAAANHFAKIVDAGEKKSARRDAFYFMLGAVFSLGAEFLFRLI